MPAVFRRGYFLCGEKDGWFNDCGWEFQGDACAIGLLIGQDDFAAGFVHDAVTDAEAEACAFADRLRREERIECAVEVGEAWAGILETDEDAVTAARGSDVDRCAGRFLPPRRWNYSRCSAGPV